MKKEHEPITMTELDMVQSPRASLQQHKSSLPSQDTTLQVDRELPKIVPPNTLPPREARPIGNRWADINNDVNNDFLIDPPPTFAKELEDISKQLGKWHLSKEFTKALGQVAP